MPAFSPAAAGAFDAGCRFGAPFTTQASRQDVYESFIAIPATLFKSIQS
jgi:hypothetical protein